MIILSFDIYVYHLLYMRELYLKSLQLIYI